MAGSQFPPGYEHPVEASEAQKAQGVNTYNYFAMPFAQHGQLWLSNTLPTGGSTVTVNYAVTYRPQPITLDSGALMRSGQELGYFHADEFHNSQAATNSTTVDLNANDQFADLSGHGNFAGDVFTETTHNFGGGGANSPSYQEGDCMFSVDGANGDVYGQINNLTVAGIPAPADPGLPDILIPSVTSTGHEECFDGGFYFNSDQNDPTAGVSIRDASGEAQSNTGDEIALFHVYLGDAIAFQNSFRATIEHGANNTYNHVDESGLRFYYMPGAGSPVNVAEVPWGAGLVVVGLFAGVIARRWRHEKAA
jgi:hypothetical protein